MNLQLVNRTGSELGHEVAHFKHGNESAKELFYCFARLGESVKTFQFCRTTTALLQCWVFFVVYSSLHVVLEGNIFAACIRWVCLMLFPCWKRVPRDGNEDAMDCGWRFLFDTDINYILIAGGGFYLTQISTSYCSDVLCCCPCPGNYANYVAVHSHKRLYVMMGGREEQTHSHITRKGMLGRSCESRK